MSASVATKTFLQLAQALHREVGAAGIPPQTVLNQRGEALRLVNWIRTANIDIQNLWVDWKFLTSQWDSPTIANQATLGEFVNSSTPHIPQNLAAWDYETWTITPPGDTQPQQIQAYEWADVRREIFSTDPGQPWRVIVMPDNTLMFDPAPDDIYTVSAGYFLQPVDLVNDSDVPAIPARFQDIIRAAAQIKYANFENAPEQLNAGTGMYTDYLARLENDQLPNDKNSRFRQGSRIQIRVE